MSRAVFSIVPIVEGHGEVHAVPLLLRRLADHYHRPIQLEVMRPIRRSRDRLAQQGELEKDVELAADKLTGPGAILILLDSEGDCPAITGPQLLHRARTARPDRLIEVVLAHQEYEAWFLAAAASIRGKRGLSGELLPPQDPESVQGAKEWLKNNMQGSRTYSETVDQPALTALFDIEQAKSCLSFQKLCRVMEKMLSGIR